MNEAPAIPEAPSPSSRLEGRAPTAASVPFLLFCNPQGATEDGIQTNSDNHLFLISPGKGTLFFLKDSLFPHGDCKPRKGCLDSARGSGRHSTVDRHQGHLSLRATG